MITFYGGFIFLLLAALGKPVSFAPVISLTAGFLMLLISAILAYNELENEKEQIVDQSVGKLDIEISTIRKDKMQDKAIFHGVPFIVWEVGVKITNKSSLKNICIKKVWIEKSKDGLKSATMERERISRYDELRPYLTWRIADIEDHPYLEPRKVISGDFIFLDSCGLTKEHLEKAMCTKYGVMLFIEDDTGNIYESNLGEQ